MAKSSFPSDAEYQTVPVPDDACIAWWRVAAMNSVFSLSLPTLVGGLDIARESGGTMFLIGTLTAGALLAVIAAVTGAIGSVTRLSSYMLTRIAFGTRGAALLNLVFALSLLGWFGVNIELFAHAIQLLLPSLGWPSLSSWLVQAGAGVLMTATTVVGLSAIDALALVFTPVLLLVTILMADVIVTKGGAGAITALHGLGQLTFGEVVSGCVGGTAVGVVIMPDTCRFLRNWPEALWVALLAFLISATAVTIVGGLAGLATGQVDMLELMVGLGLGLAATAVVIGGSWTINALNLYSAVLSLATTAPRARRSLLATCCGIGGTIASFFDILSHFVDFLIWLSLTFVPVAGVLAADFLFARPAAYRGAGPRDTATIEWPALGAWLLGAAVGIFTSKTALTLSSVPALDAMLVAGFAHLGLCRLSLRASSEALR